MKRRERVIGPFETGRSKDSVALSEVSSSSMFWAGTTTPSWDISSAEVISSSAAFSTTSETSSSTVISTSSSPSKVNSSRFGLKDSRYLSGRTVVGNLADVASLILHSPPWLTPGRDVNPTGLSS